MRSIRLISVFRSIYNHDPIFNSLYLSYFHAQCFLQHRETKLITKKNIRDPVSTYRSKNIVSKHNSHVPPFFHLRYESRIIVVPSRFIDHPNFSAPFFPLSPPPDNKRYHHPSSAFYLFFPPFFQSSPSFLGRMDTFARSPCGLHNGRLILDVPSNSSARLRLLPPFLPPFLPLPGGFSYAINRECPLLRVTHNGSSDRTIRIDRGELYIRISSGYLVIRDTWPALGYGRVTARR